MKELLINEYYNTQEDGAPSNMEKQIKELIEKYGMRKAYKRGKDSNRPKR